jgi:uncharacterized protein YdaU (DUF1376 family)
MLHNHNGGPPLYDADIRMTFAKLDLQDFIDGVRGMKPDEIGVYAMFIFTQYLRMERLPADDRYCATALGFDIRVWNRIKKQLIKRGKIQTDGEHYWNGRAEIEITKFCMEQQRRRDVAAQREAEKRRSREAKADVADSYRTRNAQLSNSYPLANAHLSEKVNEINETEPDQCCKEKKREEKKREDIRDVPLPTESVAASGDPQPPAPPRRDVVVRILADAFRMPTDNAETWLANQIALAGQDIVLEAVRIYVGNVDRGEIIAKPAVFISKTINRLMGEQQLEKSFGKRVDNRPPWAKKLDAANSITQQMIKEAMGNG